MKSIPFALALIICVASTLSHAAPETTLVLVNGEAVTSEQINGMIMDMHRSGGMQDAMNRDLTMLLNKAVNDLLIVQQALSMGMDQDASLLPILEEKKRGYAVKALVDASFPPPKPLTDEEVRADFEKYYWQIQVRQISLPSEQEATAIRQRILNGEDMEGLATEMSLDVHRFRGGLHNLKYWADVENPIRDQVRDHKAGFLSKAFPYRQAFSLLKIEDLRPVDESAWDQQSPTIRRRLRAAARDRAWAAYVDSLQAVRPIVQNHEILLAIHADKDLVFEGAFLVEDETPALSCVDVVTTAGDMRKAISHTAMENGTTPFDQLMAMALERESERLALRTAAVQGGYMDHLEVSEQWRHDRDEALIQAYLAEMVVDDITFNHEEFEAFYQEHLDDFRGPEEVRLDVVVVPDEQTARTMEEHLAQGADFDYVREQHLTDAAGSPQPEWAPLDVFSKVIRDEVERLEIGGSSKAIPIPTGWMIFRILDRRDGRAPTLEEVDLEIRKVMFQRKFTEKLDAHLELLKERSEIVRNEENIEEFFAAGTE